MANAKFGWDKARARIVEAAGNALRDVGFVLQSRRLHLDMTQSDVAAETCRILGVPARVQQPHIDNLEDGELPGVMGGSGYAEIEAVLRALQWRDDDLDFMKHMIKEFARIR
ncbi:MAG: hypothetical protein GIX03_07205 [Candidatus Eremiobacteraeota bacterium]|nr:hypothetical protein [Candidatus Eremiobacteraeota bacterium]